MTKTAILKNATLSYNIISPFHPSENYPEYPFKQIGNINGVYDSVRKLFAMLEMDTNNYNTSQWNPLGEIIKPGNTVLIKPNFVKESNPGVDFSCLVTQGSIIRAVLDYVYIALKGTGRIIIGDAPIQSCNFAELINSTGLYKIAEFYKTSASYQIEITDLRLEIGCLNEYHIMNREKRPGDTGGYATINLGRESELCALSSNCDKFRVTNYDRQKMRAHHHQGTHEYIIANTFLRADVIINLPKLKTHRKAGITGALKNMVGINGTKDCLPHHRAGSISEGGDEYLHKSWRKRLITKLYEQADVSTSRLYLQASKFMHRLIWCTELLFPYDDPYFEGSWYGNDTIPRTITDLNKIVFYADKNGILQNSAQRKMFIIVDAIVAGEMEGPLYPAPKHCGLLIAGYNPVAVDLVCSTIMGFDYNKIPKFRYSMHSKKYPLYAGTPDGIEIVSNQCTTFAELYKAFGCNFIPAKGWKGHIENNTEREP